MNTQSITKEEFFQWLSRFSEKGYVVKSEVSSFNKNDINYYVELPQEQEVSRYPKKVYLLSKYKNGVGKVFYYKNINIEEYL